MRRFVVAVSAVALLGSGCTVERSGGDARPERDGPAEFTVEDETIAVAPGESFTIAVEDNPSVGDDWLLSDEPDEEVVTAEGDHYVADSAANAPGSGGTRYFRFEAHATGTTSVELLNCYRGCQDPEDERRYLIDIEVG
jgi:inhibitor of cysteine peptidase